MAFEQATIKVEKVAEFEELKAAIDRCFQPESVGRFLKRLSAEGLRVRDWDAVIGKDVLGKVDSLPGRKALQLYQALSVSDQAQMREFYLSRVEEVDSNLRARFHKVYQYY